MGGLSVVIITLNEEKNLDRCLRSIVRIADEIVIVDSGSTDRTIEIAHRYHAKIFTEPFRGYVAQKNFADACASHDWILSIDADEALSPELDTAIRQIKGNEKHDAYEVKRLTNYCGKWIRHCGWYPDKKIRLFHRQKGKWSGEQIHESWQPHPSSSSIGQLSGDLLHYSYYTLSDHLKQIEKFTEIMARRDVANGKNSTLWYAIASAHWKFIQSYILQLGVLDGAAGFQVCKLSAFATYMKYSKIRQYYQFNKEGKPY